MELSHKNQAKFVPKEVNGTVLIKAIEESQPITEWYSLLESFDKTRINDLWELPGARFRTILYAACRSGNYSYVKVLSKIPNIIFDGVQDQNSGSSPLHVASWYEFQDIVAILLMNGADPNIPVYNKANEKSNHTKSKSYLPVWVEYNCSPVKSKEILSKRLANYIPQPELPQTQSIQSRITDVGKESGIPLDPITLSNTPLLSLADSLSPIQTIITDLDTFSFLSYEFADQLTNNPFNLSRDEAAAINIYTREWDPPKESLYFKLNSALRTADRKQIVPFYPYLKLLLTALSKINSYKSPSFSIWRGVEDDDLGTISKNYTKGRKYFWWGLSSCTTNMEVLDNFMGKDLSKKKVIFNIHIISHSVDIKDFSLYASECEVLLLPARYFEVINYFEIKSSQAIIIELQEINSPSMIKGIVFPTISISSNEQKLLMQQQLLQEQVHQLQNQLQEQQQKLKEQQLQNQLHEQLLQQRKNEEQKKKEEELKKKEEQRKREEERKQLEKDVQSLFESRKPQPDNSFPTKSKSLFDDDEDEDEDSFYATLKSKLSAGQQAKSNKSSLFDDDDDDIFS